MPLETYFKDHWIAIEPERLERYEQLFAWNPASAPLFEPADIGPGHVVADFGCGPGHMAIELANWVGSEGHVHAIDINSDFVARAREKAELNGLANQITVHQLDGEVLPLADNSLDRIVARNTIIYVDAPLRCFKEFKRVLKPGGKAHAIEGDWPIMVVEPVPPEEWSALIDAASHACRTPDIGRKLFGIARQAGYSDVALQVITRPDIDGQLQAMIQIMAGYARDSGRLSEQRIDAILEIVDRAIKAGNFLALAPQFVVTATV